MSFQLKISRADLGCTRVYFQLVKQGVLYQHYLHLLKTRYSANSYLRSWITFWLTF